MIRIDDKALCCGCGACTQACPVDCIALKPDGEGFLYPSVDAGRCVGCGRCEAVCPIIAVDSGRTLSSGASAEPRAVGGWNLDEAVRQASSSGGVFTLLASRVLERGGVVFGAAMRGHSVEHIAVSDARALSELRGSKYVQSATGDAYRQAKALLKEGRPVLFSGTPCQTAGLAAYLGGGDENLLLVDFVCHGVPSPLVFSEYLDSLEKKHGSEVVAFSFRGKEKGWFSKGSRLQVGPSARFADGSEASVYPAIKDSYINGFLEDITLRPSCYQCRFKGIPRRAADITIADFWGVDGVMPDMNDGKGTSLVLIHTERGEAIFDSIKDSLRFRDCDWREATAKNPSLLHSSKLPPERERFFAELQRDGYGKTARRHASAGRIVAKTAARVAWQMLERVVLGALAVLARLLHIPLTEKLKAQAVQFVKFCMVGVSNVIVAYSVNVLTLFLLGRVNPGMKSDYIVANIVAFLVSVYWSFYWNSRKVFNLDTRDKSVRRKALLRSYMCYGFTGIVLNNALSTLWIRVLGISKFISPLLNLAFTIPLNYLTNKKWAFAVKDRNGKGA